MLKYLSYTCLLIVWFVPELFANHPECLKPRPIALSVFAGLESQYDHYCIKPEPLIPDGYEPDAFTRDRLFWGGGVHIPLNKICPKMYHDLVVAFSMHNSLFYIRTLDVQTEMENVESGEIFPLTGAYQAQVERDNYEFSLNWNIHYKYSGWWYSIGVLGQITYNFRRDDVFVLDMETFLPNNDFRVPQPQRFDMDPGSNRATVKAEYQEIDPWSFGLISSIGYNFRTRYLRFGPMLSFAYTVSNIDGGHADWRRLSPRLGFKANVNLWRE